MVQEKKILLDCQIGRLPPPPNHTPNITLIKYHTPNITRCISHAKYHTQNITIQISHAEYHTQNTTGKTYINVSQSKHLNKNDQISIYSILFILRINYKTLKLRKN